MLRVVDILAETENRMRYALSRRTLLETALIRCARAATVVSLDELVRRIGALQAGPGEPPPARPPAPAAVETAPQPSRPPAHEQEAAPPEAPRPEAADRFAEERSDLTARWHEILDYVGRAAALARNALLDARPQQVAAGEVVIGFDPEFAGNLEKVENARVRKALGKKLSMLLDREVAVRFEVLEEDAETEPLPADHEPAPPAPKGKTDRKTKAARTDWHEDPAVRKTLEMFHGDIVDIRD